MRRERRTSAPRIDIPVGTPKSLMEAMLIARANADDGTVCEELDPVRLSDDEGWAINAVCEEGEIGTPPEGAD